jgi:ubiquinone/menaquinone biosynthesis C-methylase UbiE
MNNFESFRVRWNSRAENWDSEISKPDHYANFEAGYEKFLKFEEDILSEFGEAEAGIDLGCGTAVAAGPMAEKVNNLFLLDLAESMLAEAIKKYPGAIFLHSSVTAIPVEKETMDYAVSRGVVISHLPPGEQGNFLTEVKRILKPDGMFIFDFLNNLKTADFHPSSEKTVYTIQEITEVLRGFGFEVMMVDGDENSRVVRVAAWKS